MTHGWWKLSSFVILAAAVLFRYCADKQKDDRQTPVRTQPPPPGGIVGGVMDAEMIIRTVIGTSTVPRKSSSVSVAGLLSL